PNLRMDAGSLPGWANVWSRAPRYGDGQRDVLALRIAGFPVFRLLSHCYFSWARRRRELQAAALRTTPRLQEEANVLETRRKSIGPSAHLRRREEKVSWLGDGRRCFSLLFTMWVVADRTCNHSPKLSAKDDRRRGVPVHAYLNSSFRFVD